MTAANRVSIHAPAKGRHNGILTGTSVNPFQSTPPRRGDLARQPHVGRHSEKFQSTPPRRGDRRPGLCMRLRAGFNPRPREGATTICAVCGRPAKSFNPRPREGATRITVIRAPRGSFQSTPPRRGDQNSRSSRPSSGKFQSTPPRRGDANTLGILARLSAVSIHAPAKGRLTCEVHPQCQNRFQSTPPRRGDAGQGPQWGDFTTGFNPRPREGATGSK